ncbi:MAG: pentapeptide repeat-containing protein [Cyanobacteria bacterium]|nr:pentapeptide repeat-containing protein [Cyanobacteriota bacterium]MDA1020512.1 pentapeptide repeat-containing protein [Cyanobacteriota bacterium]
MEEEPENNEELSFEQIEEEAQLEKFEQSEDGTLLLEIDDDDEKPKVTSSSKDPWLNFKTIDFGRDIKNLINKPFWVLVNFLLILFLVFFLLLFADYLEETKYNDLIAYVAVNHHMPENYQGEIPELAQELMHHHHLKQAQVEEARKLVKDDPRINDPVMGDFYPEALSNEDVILILQGQDIGMVTRSGAVKTELMNLSGLDLSKLSFDEMNNFLQSDLRYTSFEGVNQANMSFRGASAEYAQFVDAKLPEANFIRARIDSANFYNSTVYNSLFTGAIGPRALMSESDFHNSKFDETLFKLADFSGSNLENCNFRSSNLEAASFRGANLKNVNFKGSNLRSVNFVNANLEGADLSNTGLEAANFEGANLQDTKFNDADLNQANFHKVRNANEKQFKSSKTKVGIRNIPDYVFPKQRSYRERFSAPNDVY